ncbi:hypothetical protein BGZ57DRAFT_852153 [Hyaloscypha finlandica]|nr:hypothetical protein BGZ57DRAFT_852153 [Hyaloscypha finlandica]
MSILDRPASRAAGGGIGTAGAGPGRPGMQPSIEILNAPSASAGFHREGDNSQRRFWPGQTPPVLASSLLRTLRKAILLFPGCWAMGLHPRTGGRLGLLRSGPEIVLFLNGNLRSGLPLFLASGSALRHSRVYCTAEQLPGVTQLPHKSSRAFPLPEPLLANEMSPMAASGGSLTNWTLELVIFGGVNAHLSAKFYAAVAVG